MKNPIDNSKLPMMIVAALVATVLGFFGWAQVVAPTTCQETAFEESTLYKTLPRKFYQVRLEQKSGFLPKLTYLISMQDIPLMRVKLTSMSCSFISETAISDEEFESVHFDQANR